MTGAIAKTKIPRRQKSEMKDRMRGFLMFLPNLVRLLGRLLKDSRVATADKALFLGAIVYVISPIDLIPDILPFIGQVDDLYVVALSLLRLINRTDDAVITEHWAGGGDIVSLANSIAGLAPKILPKRVSRVLTSRVELAPAGQLLSGIVKRDQVLVREIAGDDEPLIAKDSRP
ncbi:MAG: YkvA family protein [Pyrinomonadaceae bacterium]